jgi:hypothetical protein
MVEMKKIIIDELRKCASVKNKKKTWISELDDEKLYQIFLMLKSSSSSRKIAEHVNGVWEINKESSVHSLSQGIQKFKRRIEHMLVTEYTPSGKVEPDSSINDDKTDILETNQRLADQLRSRIEKMMREEKEQGVSYPNLCKDVLALNSLEKTILKEIDWRLKNKDRLIEGYEERQQRELGDRFDKFIEKHLPTDEERDRMVKGMSRFLELVSEASVPMRQVIVNGKETYEPIN